MTTHVFRACIPSLVTHAFTYVIQLILLLKVEYILITSREEIAIPFRYDMHY